MAHTLSVPSVFESLCFVSWTPYHSFHKMHIPNSRMSTSTSNNNSFVSALAEHLMNSDDFKEALRVHLGISHSLPVPERHHNSYVVSDCSSTTPRYKDNVTQPEVIDLFSDEADQEGYLSESSYSNGKSPSLKAKSTDRCEDVLTVEEASDLVTTPPFYSGHSPSLNAKIMDPSDDFSTVEEALKFETIDSGVDHCDDVLIVDEASKVENNNEFDFIGGVEGDDLNVCTENVDHIEMFGGDRCSMRSARGFKTPERNSTSIDLFNFLKTVAKSNAENQVSPASFMRVFSGVIGNTDLSSDYASSTPSERAKVYRELHSDLVNKLSKEGLNDLCFWKGIDTRRMKKKGELANGFLERVLPEVHRAYNTYSPESVSELQDLDFEPNCSEDSEEVNVAMTSTRKRKGSTLSLSGAALSQCGNSKQQKTSRNFKSHRMSPTLSKVKLSEFTGRIKCATIELCDPSTYKKLSSMSLAQLLEDSCHDVPQPDQILMILKQTDHSPSSSSNLIDPINVTEIIGICQNPKMNAYLSSMLHISLHLTVSLIHFYFIARKVNEEQNGLKMIPSRITLVSDTTPVFKSANHDLIVWNVTDNVTHPMLHKIRTQYMKAFKDGLLLGMKPNEKKRTNASDVGIKKSPVLHSGFTMSNATEYANNRKTHFGHTSPSLITTYTNELSHECRRSYAKAIAMSNAIFEESPACYKGNKSSKTGAMLLQKYHRCLGLDPDAKPDAKYCEYLRNTGTTAFFKSHVRRHRDKLNDPTFANSAVISVNIAIDAEANVPMTRETKEWLSHAGHTKTFPFCHVNYSRRVCTHVSKRYDIQLDLLDDKKHAFYYLRQAIYDAISDCDSISNHSKTFESGNGLTYEAISNAVLCFNKEQHRLHKLAENREIKQVYQPLFKTMGSSVMNLITVRTNQIVSKKALTPYTWVAQCKGQRVIPCHPMLPCPKTTYQGPIVSLTAAYDPMRYLSLLLDAYADIKANVCHGGEMSPKNKLAYAAFVSIQCNGSLVISEILRNLAKDNWSSAKQFKHQQFSQCLWSLLVDTEKKHTWSTLGSCTQPRFQISIGTHEFDFLRVESMILNRFSFLHDNDSNEVLYDKFVDLFSFLKKNVKHIGHVTGLKFLQLSALIGLLPLPIATFATVDSGGPGKLLKVFDGIQHPNTTFLRLHSEFKQIWGPRFTMAYFENLLCELWRELLCTIPKEKKRLMTPSDFSLLHKINDTFTKKSSPKEDHIVLYQHRGLRNCVSNLFRLHIGTGGKVTIEMKSFVTDTSTKRVSPSETVKFDSFDRMCVDSYYHGYNT